MSFARIGVVTGVQAEQDALYPDVPRRAIDGARGVSAIEVEGRTILLACAGIGKVAAATAAAALVAGHGVQLLACVGTAGGVAPGVGSGPFWIEGAVQADFGARRAGGFTRYTAGSWPIGEAVLEGFSPLPLDTGLPPARIATSDLFVECGIHAGELRDSLGVTLVDMETAAIAQAAAILGVPWIAIKATTDGADGDSAGDFGRNLARMARAAARAMERAIAQLSR